MSYRFGNTYSSSRALHKPGGATMFLAEAVEGKGVARIHV